MFKGRYLAHWASGALLQHAKFVDADVADVGVLAGTEPVELDWGHAEQAFLRHFFLLKWIANAPRIAQSRATLVASTTWTSSTGTTSGAPSTTRNLTSTARIRIVPFKENLLEPSPIHGMSQAIFKRLMDEEFERFEYEQEEAIIEEKRLPNDHLSKIQKMKMGQSSKDCSICCVKFEKGTHMVHELGAIIMKLPCKHIFHETCLIPWFQRESKCPNCRFDLNEHFKS
jgi:hypothetical protein